MHIRPLADEVQEFQSVLGWVLHQVQKGNQRQHLGPGLLKSCHLANRSVLSSEVRESPDDHLLPDSKMVGFLDFEESEGEANLRLEEVEVAVDVQVGHQLLHDVGVAPELFLEVARGHLLAE